MNPTVETTYDFRTLEYSDQLDKSLQDFEQHLLQIFSYYKLSDHNQTEAKLAEIAALRLKSEQNQAARINECEVLAQQVEEEIKQKEAVVSKALETSHGFYLKQGVFREWVRYCKLKKKMKVKKAHVGQFFERGLLQRTLKYWKQYAHMFGKELLGERLEMSVQNRVHSDIETAKGEIGLLEQMIREIETQYKLQLRKRNILKSQLDQAYLRGVTAISSEAMQMAQKNLSDVHCQFVETKTMHISQNV